MLSSSAKAPNQRNNPLWRDFELEVQKMLGALDPGATVVHNKKVPGRLSGTARQVDVWAIGKCVGQQFSIAVECKRHRRVVNVEVIDQFVGKLLDIGADRGVIYSWSGFTDSAVKRAWSARNPAIMVVELEAPTTGGLACYAYDPMDQTITAPMDVDLSTTDYAAWLVVGRWP